MRAGPMTSHSNLTQPAGTDAIPSKQASFPGTYDFLSAFYRVRALPLISGGFYKLTVRGESQTYQVELRVTGNEVIRTMSGRSTQSLRRYA